MSKTKGHLKKKMGKENTIWNLKECAQNAARQITENYLKTYCKTGIPNPSCGKAGE